MSGRAGFVKRKTFWLICIETWKHETWNTPKRAEKTRYSGSRTVPRRTVPRRTIPQTDNFPNEHFPNRQFPEWHFPELTFSQITFFFYLGWLFLLKIRRHELWLDLDMVLNICVTKNWRSFWWTETYSLRVIKGYFKNHLYHKSGVFITSLLTGNHKLKLFGISFSRI